MPQKYLDNPAPRFVGKHGLSRLYLTLLWVGTALGAAGQSAPSFFRADAAARAAAAPAPLTKALRQATALTLDVAGLRAALATAPAETRAGAAPLVLALPLPGGGTARFAVREAPILAPALAAQFPAIRTYAGVGLDEPGATVRLDFTPRGFHAQVLAGGGNSFYIDPVSPAESVHYLAFFRRDLNRAATGPVPACAFAPTKAQRSAAALRMARGPGALAGLQSSGPQLRTYRLALANTPEYALTKGNTAAGVMAAEATTVNRVVGVYEKELAVRLVLVANNSQLVFLSGTGPQPSPAYTDNDGGAMLGQNQINIDRIISPANYDIGHVFSTAGGGVAYQGVVCSGIKAGGVTGSPNPVGDAFDIDFVAHEIGHQFGASHTFNNDDAGSCAGNRDPSVAFEPGSGSTIMAYAGICNSANDLQPNSDPVFHTGSYEEMRAFIDTTPCGTATATGNTAPVVTAPASGKTLPVGTPFRLTAAATDAEGDALTYFWEELDLGPAGSPTAPQVAGQNVPLFRSFLPTASSTRYFPRLSDLVNNTTVLGERLPTVTRALTFRCTARDQHSGPAGVIGGVNFSAPVNLSVSSAAGPFVVATPNTAVTWTGGAAQVVTWDVAGTDAAPVSCALVNIRLSLDGGFTYPTTLAANVPNSGSAVVVAPSPATTQTQARIMVEAADNYFFDISDANFTITPPATGPTISGFSPTGGPAGTVVTVLGSNFTGATAVAFNGTAAGFVVNSATQLTATVAAGSTTGAITVTGPTGTGTSATAFVVGAPPTISGFSPGSGAVGASVVITGTSFTLATQVRFNNVVATTFTVNSATQITAPVPAGATTGPIRVTTPVASATSATNFVVILAPAIASFTPTAGAAGNVVVITGSSFTGATAVSFNGTAATFTVNSNTQITATVPTGATSGPIRVAGPGGTGVSVVNFIIPPANDQCANALPLACGQTLTGTTVGATATGDPTGSCNSETVDDGGVFYTITGTGASITISTCDAGTDFDTKLFVYSGACGAYTCVTANDDVPCTAAQYSSEVTFNSVAGTGYYVFVTGYAGITGTFALRATCATPPPAPTITALMPTAGPIASGLQITGTNFTSATRVSFNGVTATFYVVDAQTIAATVPNGATTGNVVVVGPGGSSNGVPFMVTTPTPAVTALSPASGAVGIVVTLTGSGFGGATSVQFNGVAAVIFNVSSAISLTATVPAGATTGNVVVATAGGTSAPTAVNVFTVGTGTATATANQTEFSVWPNPVAGSQTLHVTLATAATKGQATLRNVLGQVVLARAFSGSATKLATAGLAAGTYLLTVQTDAHAPTVRRVVVE